MKPLVSLLGALCLASLLPLARAGVEPIVTVHPAAFDGALRNPLMGLTARERGSFEWATLTHHYIGWNELEESETDGVERIVALCNAAWRGFPAKGIKVIPRVYLEYPGKPNAWPEGLADGDYESEQFRARLRRFVQKLGQAWDRDPRVAFVELGLFGKWGEHHSPRPSAAIQAYAAGLFREAFRHKQVSVRRAWTDFSVGDFAEYWDSFAHWDEMGETLQAFSNEGPVGDLYLRHYFGGEVAYDWGNWRLQPGESPDLTLSEPAHLAYMLSTVRFTHCTQLRWVGDYSRGNPAAVGGAEALQKTLGYRFVIREAEFTRELRPGQPFSLRLDVVNEGVAPFYYPWPVQVAFLDPKTRKVRWQTTLASVDIRTWTPGAHWTSPRLTRDGDMLRADWPQESPQGWQTPAGVNHVEALLRPELPAGRYLLAIAVLDPAGMRPGLRFAIANYLAGGYHPLGYVGVGGAAGGALEPDYPFFRAGIDPSLSYEP